MARMLAELEPEQVERLISDQRQLAALATCPEVRAMHLELAALHAAQLGYILASRKLGFDPVCTAHTRMAA